MLRSYLTLALRSLRRRRAYALINTVGLTVGLACCAIVVLFIQHEMAYDHHHEDADRIYRLTQDYRSSTYSTISFEGYHQADASEQNELAETLVRDVAAIEQATNFEIFQRPAYVEVDGRTFETDRYLMTTTGAAFLDLFTFDVVAGQNEDALDAPYTAILTKPVAERYFGSTSPIGQTITLDSLELTVTSVVAEPPSNSRITFDIAAHVKRIPNWGAYHYVRLAPGTDPEAVEPQIAAVKDRVDPRRVEDPYTRSNLRSDDLQALTDIHLGPRLLYDDTTHRDVRYLWAFGAIGLLILSITAINYANLSIALYAERNAEIGVRKALGAQRGQVAAQFLTEAMLLALLCVPLALLLASLVLPGFNAMMDMGIAPLQLLQPEVLIGLLGLAVLTGLVAGGYPAIALARKQAINLFERTLHGHTGWSLRHGLIVLQFSVLIGLGSLSWIVHDQLTFMQTRQLDAPTDRVVRVTMTGDSLLYQRFKERLQASPHAEAVGTGIAPRPESYQENFKAADSDITYDDGYTERLDLGWFDVMQINHPVVETMRREGGSTQSRLLVNRTAAERLGYENPAGKTVVFSPNGDNPTYATIDGVMPDMHFRPLRQRIKPVFFRIYVKPGWAFHSLVRLKPGQLTDGMEDIKAAWTDLVPGEPAKADFLSDQIAALYDQERRFGRLSLLLTGLAVLLAALGLVGLTAYMTRLRMKEISVRKVLGASIADILVLLNREFVVMVGVALLAGAPLAFWLAERWLTGFAYRVDISPWVFGAAGLLALVIALGAASIQSIRAARTDPAQVLRTE